MSVYEQKVTRRPKVDQNKEKEQVQELPSSNSTAAKKGEELKKEMDDLLDDIEDVLEENAAEFVRDYQQKGGQ